MSDIHPRATSGRPMMHDSSIEVNSEPNLGSAQAGIHTANNVPNALYLSTRWQASQPWLVCMSAALFFFYAFIQMNMFNALGPQLLTHLQLTTTQLGNLSANYFYAYVLMLFPAGIILDNFSVRRVILITMSLCIISTLLFAFSSSYHQALACRFLTGLGAAFTLLAAIRLATRWFPARKMAFVIGCVVTMAMLGGTLAQTPLTLIADDFGWRHMLLLNALFGVVLLAIIGVFVRDYPANQRPDKDASVKHIGLFAAIGQVIRNAQNWWAGLYTSLMNLPILLLGAVWGGLYLTQADHLSRTNASLVVSMLFFGAIIGSPLVGWLSDRLGKRCVLMQYGAVLSFALVLVLMYIPHLLWFELMVIFLLLGVITSTQVLSYPLVAESNCSSVVGTAEGLSAVLIMSGGFLQPLFGYLLQYHAAHPGSAHALYTASQLQHAMLIFPCAFLLSFFVAFLLRDVQRTA